MTMTEETKPKLVFDDCHVLDILRHEHPQFYTLQMVEGPDVMVSIDKLIDELWEFGRIGSVGSREDIQFAYNNEVFDDMDKLRTQITNADVFSLLNYGLVGYTEIKPLNETV